MAPGQRGAASRHVLVVGQGGREHALVWALARSPRVGRLSCAPGNPGIGELAELVPIPSGDVERVVEWAAANRVDLAVIGPEDPLANGIVDRLAARGVPTFGPTRAAATIESSKVWAKEFFARHAIPTAAFARFDAADAARAYLAGATYPLVVKADGLAQGKGVSVCRAREGALEAVERIMERRAFGAAGAAVVIEEFLEGNEFSVIGICDGRRALLLPGATDHKAVFDGDRGPNTGGMGAYSPPGFVTDAVMRDVEERVFGPTLDGLRAEGRPFVGALFAGVMLTRDGPKVYEFNARFGDPETQALLPRLETDLLDVLEAATHGDLSGRRVVVKPDASCAVVVASPGYPGAYPTGLPIAGLDALDPDVLVFHAGTHLEVGRLVTAGGRVLAVAAVGKDLPAARARAYANVARISFDGMHYRRDIAARAVV